MYNNEREEIMIERKLIYEMLGNFLKPGDRKGRGNNLGKMGTKMG